MKINESFKDKLAYLLLIFFVTCVIGWICEEIYCFFLTGKIVNRGFYYGPYLPIYGVGAICLLPLKKIKNHPLMLLLLSMIITGIVEYFTGVYLLFVYHRRWWDYSHLLLNLKGHVCLKSISLFGMMALFLIYFLEPLISKFMKKHYKLSIICSVVFIIVFLIDFVFSTFFKY